MFWSWGGVCAQFSSQHFSPSNFPSTDAKAHYWTASMVINSNFSATSFWPPINPCCFVTQSWDMFQQYKIWHFKTISVPPPQLSVTSICLADKKKIHLCALGLGKAWGMAIPAAIPCLELQALEPSNGLGYGNVSLCRRNRAGCHHNEQEFCKGSATGNGNSASKHPTHWKSFTRSLCGFYTKTEF